MPPEGSFREGGRAGGRRGCRGGDPARSGPRGCWPTPLEWMGVVFLACAAAAADRTLRCRVRLSCRARYPPSNLACRSGAHATRGVASTRSPRGGCGRRLGRRAPPRPCGRIPWRCRHDTLGPACHGTGRAWANPAAASDVTPSLGHALRWRRERWACGAAAPANAGGRTLEQVREGRQGSAPREVLQEWFPHAATTAASSAMGKEGGQKPRVG